jgi:hypothetical protein
MSCFHFFILQSLVIQYAPNLKNTAVPCTGSKGQEPLSQYAINTLYVAVTIQLNFRLPSCSCKIKHNVRQKSVFVQECHRELT